MSGFSTYLDNLILNSIFKGQSFVGPNKYLALFSSDIGLEDNNPTSQQEVTGLGYTRIAVSNDSLTDPADGMVTNLEIYQFPIALDNWGMVSHIALVDSPNTGEGNVLMWGLLKNGVTGTPQVRIVEVGDQMIIRESTLSVGILNLDEEMEI